MAKAHVRWIAVLEMLLDPLEQFNGARQQRHHRIGGHGTIQAKMAKPSARIMAANFASLIYPPSFPVSAAMAGCSSDSPVSSSPNSSSSSSQHAGFGQSSQPHFSKPSH